MAGVTSTDGALFRERGAPIVTVEQMRALERAAMADGTTEADLQGRAAARIAVLAQRLRPDGTVVVVAGPGNNGRDAVLAGWRLAEAGRAVSIFLGPRHAVEDAELGRLAAATRELRVCRDSNDLIALRAAIGTASLVLDGLLGIGVRGPMRAPLDGLARAVNEARAARGEALAVLAVDVPSGIDADSGAVAGVAVRADATLALGGIKLGTLRFPAAELVGRQYVAGIGLPSAEAGAVARRAILEAALPPLLRARPLQSHKGSLGWALVVGGAPTYVGAPLLGAAAAARSGCGLVGLSTVPVVTAAAAVALPEATHLPRDAEEPAAVTVEALSARLDDFQAVLIGPGLGRAANARDLARELLRHLRGRDERPGVVVDADGLNALAEQTEWWHTLPEGCVLTPHYGEMGRLAGVLAGEVASRSIDLAARSADAWRQVVVLKGPHSVVAAPGGETWVYPHPNPALATAGSGDVLAGLIVGLIAQAVAPAAAARLAVGVHALAACAALERHGWDRLLASDLLPEIPAVLARLARATAPADDEALA